MLQNTQKKDIKESRICDLVLSGFIVLKCLNLPIAVKNDQVLFLVKCYSYKFI